MAWLSLAPTPLPNRDLQILLYPYDHLVMYVVFSLVSFLVWNGRERRVLTGLLLVAVLMEVIQIASPVRAFEIIDLATNLAGVFIGWALFQLLVGSRRRRRRNR